jgi:dethiobiotin synthetase
LAEEFGLPVVVVVANRLGAINHALLTVESVQRRGLPCAGVILNRVSAEEDVATATNRGMIEELAGVPILAEVGFGDGEISIERMGTFNTQHPTPNIQ